MSYGRVRGKPEFRHIPAGAQKIASKNSSAIVYFSGQPDRLMAIGFVGKAVKPAFHFRFKTEEKRRVWVADWIRGIDSAEANKVVRKAEEKAKRAAGHKLKVGSILRASWGYDQTNIDYYEVVELVGKCSVKICQIEGQSVPDDQWGDRGSCVPAPGVFRKGCEPMLKRVSPSGESVRIESFANAYLIEPVSVAHLGEGCEIKIYPKSYWSSYA